MTETNAYPSCDALYFCTLRTSSTLQCCACRYDTLTCSKSRWQEESGHRHRQKQTASWMQADPDLIGIFEQMPSAKVASTAALGQHILYRLRHLSIVLDHFCAPQYQMLRWATFRKRQSAMAKLCNYITNKDSNTVVGYGDAAFNSSAPTSSLRRRLRSLCHVYDVDEFRTSKLCCACHQPMIGMPSAASGKAHKSQLGVQCLNACAHGETRFRCAFSICVALYYNVLACLYASTVRLLFLSDQVFGMLADNEKRRRQRDYGVRLCNNTECNRMIWNRDVNGSINILNLLLSWMRGDSKPVAFLRAGNLDPGG